MTDRLDLAAVSRNTVKENPQSAEFDSKRWDYPENEAFRYKNMQRASSGLIRRSPLLFSRIFTLFLIDKTRLSPRFVPTRGEIRYTAIAPESSGDDHRAERGPVSLCPLREERIS